MLTIQQKAQCGLWYHHGLLEEYGQISHILAAIFLKGRRILLANNHIAQ